jgi:bacillithiol biosynthesis cysteine-adding enzyme BshC
MNISQLRQFSKLATDYTTAFNSSAIKDFFPLPPTGESSAFAELLKERTVKASSEEERSNRRTLVETLRKQHSNAGTLTAVVEENLNFLESEKCCAIVTGQQVGIFGGPLYTIYKALHTIILADEYRKHYPEYKFVPIFWQETEDHDFEETSFINIITANFELRKITYQPSEDISRRQVGGIRFEKEALEKVFSEIESFIPRTDFTDEVMALYRSGYQDDFTFAEAQAQLLGELLCEDGLLILNPNSAELKKQATHLFKKEIETAPFLSEEINRIGKILEAHSYHAQLDQEGVNLFITEGGKRYKISRNEEGFSYNNISLRSSDLHSIIDRNPERLSMNVVMRPLVQDTILPTVAYIAGPGEIAYFAQLRAAYDWAGMPMPRIVPRIGMTIVEDRFEKLFGKYQIFVEDFLEKNDDIVSNILRSEQEAILIGEFSIANKNIDSSLESLRATVVSTDTTLDAALTSVKGKILTTLKDFENKSMAAERKKQSNAKQQFEKATNVLLPHGNLQERELNLLYFLNKYGMDFWKKMKVDRITNPIPLNEHQIVKVSDILQ